MGRDKLITVRIEQDLRDAFNRWTKDKGTDASSVLYDFIKRCLDGSIDANLATGKTIIGLDDSRLDAIIENRLSGVREELDTLSATVANLDRTVGELFDRQNHAGQRAIDLTGRVEAIESLRSEFAPALELVEK
jgi:hypothetical protein